MTAISKLSLEYIRTQVSAQEDGVAIDPTTDVVAMALVAVPNDPVSGDFKAATWETDDEDRHFARILVGPTSTIGVLTEGRYGVWVKITDNPEIPVKRAGYLTVY